MAHPQHPHQEEILIAVAGGGIAGLSFAIAAARYAKKAAESASGAPPPPPVRVIVLERGKADDVDRRTDYSHSLSLRTDCGGVKAVKELGLYEGLHARSTPTKGFYLGHIGSGRNAKPKVAVSTDWFLKMDRAGLRIFRFDLWQSLRAAALAEGVEIRYNSRVSGAELVDEEQEDHSSGRSSSSSSGSSKVRITCDSGATLVADLVVAADGHRSAVRQAVCPEEKLNFLHNLILSARFSLDELPPVTKDHHGLLCGPNGTSLFMSDEGDNLLLFALGISNSEPLPHNALADNESLRERVRAASRVYPEPFATLISRLLDTEVEKSSVLSCFDKLPTPPALGGKVVFIGDASHPVSPYAGAGANMALEDGIRLAQMLFETPTPTASFPAVVDAFYAKREKECRDIVMRQRRTISFAHTTSTLNLVGRSLLLNTFPFLLNPPQRKKALATVLTAGVALGAYVFASKHWK